MDVDQGFIVGVYNYCDRWCERCALTSRCRVFADSARHEAALDPALKAVADAPPLEPEPSPPAWLEALLEEMAEAASEDAADPELEAFMHPTLPPEHAGLLKRAEAYGRAVCRWLRRRPEEEGTGADPVEVIGWFATLLPAKVHRALTGLARFDGDRTWPADHEGSAKVALLGLDRSLAAWTALAGLGQVSQLEVQAFTGEIAWMRERLETMLPLARDFVRPGLDEPEAVAALEAAERG